MEASTGSTPGFDMVQPDVEIITFRSIHHPAERSKMALFAEKWIRVLAVLFLPFMIVATVLVLQYRPVLLFSVLTFALSILLASAWTLFDVKRTIAEVRVYPDDTVSLVSAWQSSEWYQETGGQVLDVRLDKNTLYVAVDDSVYRLDRAEWPDFDRLVDELVRLRMAANTLPY